MPPRLSIFRGVLADSDPLPPEHDRGRSEVASLEELYRSHKRGLLRFVAKTGRYDDAEDVVQQVFVNVAAKTATQDVAAPGAYLRQAAYNVIRRNARTSLRRGGDHVAIEDAGLSDGDPIAALEARDKLARVERALDKMKPLTRQIFLAHRLDGYKYAEIAEITGLSIKGVEKQMSRAIKQLSRYLLCDD